MKIIFQIEENNVTDQLITNTLQQIANSFNYSSGIGNTITGNLSLIYQGLNSASQLSVAQLATSFAASSATATKIVNTPNIGSSYGV